MGTVRCTGWYCKVIKYRNLRFNHLLSPIHSDKFKDRCLQILVLQNFVDDGNEGLFVPAAGNLTVRVTLTERSTCYCTIGMLPVFKNLSTGPVRYVLFVGT